MQPKPYSMIPALIDNTYMYVFNYSGNANDFSLDQTAFNTEAEKHFAVNCSCEENGLGLTGSDLFVTAAATKRTINIASTPTMPADTVKHPIVLYKGEPIPFSDFDAATPPSTVSGLITLKAGSETTYPSTTLTDYVVYYSDHLNGILIGGSVGNVSLPLESSSFNVIGHVDPIYKVERAGEPEANGNIQVVTSLTSFLFGGATPDTAPRNYPGEEILKRIYGSEWVAGAGWSARNAMRRPTNPFGIVIIQHSGLSLGDSQGLTWAKVTCVYHCRLTGISEIQNMSNDATSPQALQVEFNSRFPDKTDAAVIYCTG